ncbi:MAG: hypothetical protein ACLFS4_01290 [Opitutales bacterium]
MVASKLNGSTEPRPERNPGPSWGFRAMRFWRRVLPEFVFVILLHIGVWIAVGTMKSAREHSRVYLRTVLATEPGRAEIHRHFYTFVRYLLERLRLWDNRAPRAFRLTGADRHGPRFLRLVLSGKPFIAGAFHVGYSELLGFLLSPKHGRMSMLRMRVGNTEDTDCMAANYRDVLEILWINDPGERIFALKHAMDQGRGVLLLCDRAEFSAKQEAFHFLGANRWFPFTQYHLALLYDVPVVLTYALPDENKKAELRVRASPVFHPPKELSKEEQLAMARTHFQEFLTRLEADLRRRPYYWFNFEPLNPVASGRT